MLFSVDYCFDAWICRRHKSDSLDEFLLLLFHSVTFFTCSFGLFLIISWNKGFNNELFYSFIVCEALKFYLIDQIFFFFYYDYCQG